MKRTREYYTITTKNHPAGSGVSTTHYETYEQPAKDYVVFRLYLAWWKFCWKFKPMAWVIDHVAEPVSKWMHKRTCNDDCVMYTRCDDDTQYPGCGRLEVDIVQDCKLYQYDHKNSQTISRS